MKVRSLFISDCHLGSEYSNHEAVLNLIRDIECEYIYIVGDFIDGWLLKNNFRWHPNYNTIIQKLLKHSRKGVEIKYIWGNHDDFLSYFDGYFLGDIKICRTTFHKTIRGKEYIIIHGDQFDGIVTKHKWIQVVGAKFYELSLALNKISRLFKFSFSKLLKNKAKEAVKYIANYEEVVINFVKNSKCDGVITGHIHKPANYTKDGVHYVNCGDFIESNTCVIETTDGEIKLFEL